MSKFHHTLHSCHFCGSEENTVIWDLIDLTEDPDLKERLLKKQIQVFLCQNCGEEQILAEPLLYVDDEKNLVFYYCPQFADLLKVEDASNEVSSSNLPSALTEVLDKVFPPGLNDKVMRIIPQYNELIEKIHVFDHDFDDRLMEVVKIALRARYLDEEGIRIGEIFFLSASVDTILFQVYVEGEDQEIDGEVVSGGVWNTLEVYRDIYENAVDALEGQLIDEGRWQLIDEDFAMRLISG